MTYMYPKYGREEGSRRDVEFRLRMLERKMSVTKGKIDDYTIAGASQVSYETSFPAIDWELYDGNTQTLDVFARTGGNYRTWLKFDDAAIRTALSGATIDQVTLSIQIQESNSNAPVVFVKSFAANTVDATETDPYVNVVTPVVRFLTTTEYRVSNIDRSIAEGFKADTIRSLWIDNREEEGIEVVFSPVASAAPPTLTFYYRK